FNTYRFFALYANTEGWSPSEDDPAPAERSVLDRWLLARLASVVAEVREELETYQITRAYRTVGDFLVDDLSNWYVRRSRPRFWGNADPVDARAAFRTLWDGLRTLTLLVAPVTPFTADWFHRALTGSSVHLEAFPGDDAGAVDPALEAEMAVARILVSLGRAARDEVRIRVRQPLSVLHAVPPEGRSPGHEVLELVRDELNVKRVALPSSAEELVHLAGRPDFRSLGPRFQKRSEAAAAAVRALGQAELEAFREGREVAIEVDGERHVLAPGDLTVVEEAVGDLVVRSEQGATVALDPTVDEELRREGLARELVNRIQRLRRDSDLEITDRIALGIFGPEHLGEAARAWQSFIAGETLATEVAVEALADGVEPAGRFRFVRDVELDGIPAVIGLSRVGTAGGQDEG
ncbi:MAG TPA: DUF5915 domain-containing protein, partial [Longimicrobiales bacterium]|nr:DUF5915 domain-containing protein [Longimicrobiales bacterium]